MGKYIQEKDGALIELNELPKDFHPFLGFAKYYDAAFHRSHGFFPIVQPILQSTEKKGALIKNGDYYTYEIVPKTPEEIQKAEKEKIYKAKLDKYVEEQVLLDPVTNINYFEIWTPGSYAIGEKRQYKGKPFKNTIADNTNAPDKGGWTELKTS